MIVQITKISYFLVPLLFILGLYFNYSFQKIKEVETKKLQFLFDEIKIEKNVSHQLKNVPKEAEKLNKSTQNKILKIKINIFNTCFSLSEIFKV